MAAIGSSVITIIVLLCSCFGGLLTLGVSGFFIYRIFKNMSGNSAVLKTGVSAPAVIIDVADTGTTMNFSFR